MVKNKFKYVLTFISILFLAACSTSEKTESDKQNGELTVFTTIYPLQFFTEQIGGELVTVENIVPPGTDAHSVEITTKKMLEVAKSDAFIHTGTGLEVFSDSVADSLKNEDVLIVKATESVSFIDSTVGEAHSDSHEEEDDENHQESGEENHEDHGSTSDVDPHVWLDPNRSIQVAENIKNALIELSPKNKTQFENNFSTLKRELEKLNSEFSDVVSKSANNVIVVSHSAYGYWEDAYGLKQVGISGLSPTDEPSQSQLTKIIDLVKKNGYKYIFFEPNLSNKVAETVKNETGTEALTLHNLESITDENINNNEDYFVIMRKNLNVLDKALN
ncbi:adhesin [Robertmurraya yapensis]|uniref:Adhesin n=1 Tax=Bacillus yapensis TaxID=2492960 RepID=A0A3S0IA92_9BACI|nr:zinc ABC transporter substrate-binding protein [Bacillus yapensis]RTR28151.1 adhesin [Bacillus yapensis]TKS94394.1 adhesin [Bacillus yapensis]